MLLPQVPAGALAPCRHGRSSGGGRKVRSLFLPAPAIRGIVVPEPAHPALVRGVGFPRPAVVAVLFITATPLAGTAAGRFACHAFNTPVIVETPHSSQSLTFTLRNTMCSGLQ